MDRLTPEQRRKNMQAVKSKGSKIETLLLKGLWKQGLRYRKNNKSVFGNPDITFKKLKIAIFIDGEFWHGKDWEVKKLDHKSNHDFWHRKIERNIQRDIEVNSELRMKGWKIIRFWGKDVEKKLQNCISIVLSEIENARNKLS